MKWDASSPGALPTVKKMWKEYAAAVGIPFGGVQWRETEQAFYAGVFSLLAAQWNLPPGISEEGGAKWLDALKTECELAAKDRLASHEFRKAKEGGG